MALPECFMRSRLIPPSGNFKPENFRGETGPLGYIRRVMQPENQARLFKIWGADELVYGPAELPALIAWVREQRITADTWIYSSDRKAWQPAGSLPELKLFFAKAAPAAAPASAAPAGPLSALKPGALRRIKVLADLADEQIAEFIRLMEIQTVRQWTEIVRQGDPGDAMFLILEGELRVRLMVNGVESSLATLQAGEFFGEISLFDTGPRSADVVANKDSILLKITTAAFAALVANQPELAAPFLFAVAKTMTARIRASNKRYRDSIVFARTSNLAG
jgi:hypothetical protein